MNKVIGIVSGKGGVGKTTVSINLAFCLKDKTSVVLVDGSLNHPHIGLHLGRHNPEHSLHTSINHGHHISKAVYDLFGMKVVLGHLNHKAKDDDIKQQLLSLYDYGDSIILDCAADHHAMLQHCAECIIVTTNDPLSVTEAYRTQMDAKNAGVSVLGVVLNRHKSFQGGLSERHIADYLHLPILTRIPEDAAITKALIHAQPVAYRDPHAESSQAFMHLAKHLEK